MLYRQLRRKGGFFPKGGSCALYSNLEESRQALSAARYYRVHTNLRHNVNVSVAHCGVNSAVNEKEKKKKKVLRGFARQMRTPNAGSPVYVELAATQNLPRNKIFHRVDSNCTF